MQFLHDQSKPAGDSDYDRWSWTELRNRARSVAAELVATKAAPTGARVLLVYPAGLGFVAAFCGCLYARLVPVPVPPPRRAEELDRWRHIARDAGIAGVLTSADLVATVRPLLHDLAKGGFCLALDDADPSRPCSDAGAELPASLPEPSDLAFLQYTSGSTGEPKGVMISHDNLIANLRQISLRSEMTPSDHIVSWLPHYHDMGLLGGVLSPIYNGIPAALMAPAAFLRRPLRWLELATHVGGTIIGGPNFGFDHCVRRATPEAVAKLDLSQVRIAFSGAEMIRPRTLSRFHSTFASSGFRWDAFLCCYGMAEATVFISGNAPAVSPSILNVKRSALGNARVEEAQPEDTPDDASCVALAGCGRAGVDISLAIVDPAGGSMCKDREVGEIWIAGPNVSAGYWQCPEQNAESFNQELDGIPGWFRTGDLGFLHQGELYITGRLKDVIIIRGENHYPQDIEETVSACHPALAEGNAGAFALEIEGEERLGIICEVSRGALRDLDTDSIFETLRGAVSRQHDLQLATAALIPPGSLPRTPSGKVRRFACRDGLTAEALPIIVRWDACLGDDAGAQGNASTWLDELREVPRGLREDMLRRRLQDEIARLASLPLGQLPAPDVGFFDLGLDSVSVVTFGAILERELGLRPEPTLMFEHPTLNALAAHIAETILADTKVQTSIEDEPIAALAGTSNVDSALTAEIAALQRLLDADPP